MGLLSNSIIIWSLGTLLFACLHNFNHVVDELFVYQYVCPFISMSVYSTTSLSVRQDLRFLSVRKPKHTGTKEFSLKEALSIKVVP